MRSLPILLLAASSVLLRAADPEAFAVPTFESLGLYYNRPEAKTPCTVSYRAAGAPQWRQGYPLVYDAREHQYRGSLVLLQPDTAYEMKLTLVDPDGGNVEKLLKQSTRGEPVAPGMAIS